jgi:hypothetical protein
LLDNYGATIMVFTLCNIPLITKLAWSERFVRIQRHVNPP